jgi:hypothetical protein
VVLAGHVAAPGQEILDRLINAAMTVFQLVGIAARRQRQDLVAQADAEDRLVVVHHEGAQLVDQGAEVLWVAGSVADEDPVGLPGQLGEIGAPARPHHGYVARQHGPDDVILGADVDQKNREAAGRVGLGLARRHQIEDLAHDHFVGGVARLIPGRAVGQQPALHGAVLADLAGQGAGVRPADGRDLLGLQPFAQRARGRGMAIGRMVVLHDEALDLDTVGLVGPL